MTVFQNNVTKFRLVL